MELNVGKTKVVKFREAGRRCVKMSKVNWQWKGKKIEEIKQIFGICNTKQSKV